MITRKLMTMHKVLHPRDDVDRLYVSRKEVGRGLTSIKDSVDAWIQRLGQNIKKCSERLTRATRNNTDSTFTEENIQKIKMGIKTVL